MLDTTLKVPHATIQLLNAVSDNFVTALQTSCGGFSCKGPVDAASMDALLGKLPADAVADLGGAVTKVLNQGMFPKLAESLPALVALAAKVNLPPEAVPSIIAAVLGQAMTTSTEIIAARKATPTPAPTAKAAK